MLALTDKKPVIGSNVIYFDIYVKTKLHDKGKVISIAESAKGNLYTIRWNDGDEDEYFENQLILVD